MDKDVTVAIVLIELEKGKASVGLRFGDDLIIEILKKYDKIEPQEAARVAAQIVKGEISAEEVAKLDYYQVRVSPDCNFHPGKVEE